MTGPIVGDVLRPATTTVELSAHLAAAAYLMRHAGSSALVVTTDDGRSTPLGIVTDTDVSQAVADGRDVEQVRISELLDRRDLVTVAPAESVQDATRRMLAAGVHHLPVVADGGLVGVVEMSDLCRVLVLPDPAA